MEKDTYLASIKRSKKIETDLLSNPQNYKILTGERPTGKLHIGHLFGSINERVRFQKLGVRTSIVIADYQVITDRNELGDVVNNVYDIVIDNIAAGLDPENSTFFCHSQIPELNQLLIPFLSLVTESELHRNPTVKAELEASGGALSGLLLTYPIHQAADILFTKANLVPVGKDQLPHIEISRIIARRFNERFGNVFPEPEALLSKTPNIPGLDGRKMSKSFGNAISLGMSADETAAIIKKSPTDSIREISYDPENRPGVSALLTYIALCKNYEVDGDCQKQIADEINSKPNYGAGLLKQMTIDAVNDFLSEHRKKRAELSQDLDYVKSILHKGIGNARKDAIETLEQVQNAMGMIY